jgi:hypothetical protein
MVADGSGDVIPLKECKKPPSFRMIISDEAARSMF